MRWEDGEQGGNIEDRRGLRPRMPRGGGGVGIGAPGDFTKAYVIAHEVGHHVQKVLGTAAKVQSTQRSASSRAQANRYSVALELQADCYAGVWAANAPAASRGAIGIDRRDFEDGLRAANAIGDDTLQKCAQGRVMPDSFTHGSSAQRVQWLRHGFDTGDPALCNTFASL
ncbi:MAG: neutral zinc metallopeptidase [Parvibaculum sp.]